jgi:DNA polymerase
MIEVKGYPPIMATVHPSSILRAQTEEDRESERRHFVADLIAAAKALRNSQA